MDQKNFDEMFSYIEFVGKILKKKDNQEVWYRLSMEALACSTDHLGVIKFSAIHVKAMEAYQLQQNMGMLREMFKYYDSQNQSLDN